MPLRIAIADDIPAIVAIERKPGARQFGGQWTEERHRTTLTGGAARYYVNGKTARSTHTSSSVASRKTHAQLN